MASAYGASFAPGMIVISSDGAPALFEQCGSAAVVDIVGPVVQHNGRGWDNYDDIARRVEAATASSSKAVVLRIDSPGGDVLGMIECAREIRATCAAAGKPLFAFVDGMACSAAYALSTAASVIVTPPASLVGSVGIFQPIVDVTAADRAMGLTITMVSSGARKLDGNPHTTTTEDAVVEVQKRVDGHASLFFDLVAEMRPGITADDLRALEGASFLGKEAVSVGLADAVGSWSDVLAMAASADKATAPAAPAKEKTMAEEEKVDKKAAARKAFFGAMEKAFEAAFGDEETDKEKAPAKEEPKKEEGKAAAEEPKKEEGASAKAFVATVSASEFAKLAASHHALETKLLAKEEGEARAALYSTRPDFTAAQRRTLDLLPIAEVKAACETWERIGRPAMALASAPTRGKGQNNDDSADFVDEQTAKAISARMGGESPLAGISHEGGALTLGPMTPEQARDHLKKLQSAGGAS
jgi:ClpP class serine protease